MNKLLVFITTFLFAAFSCAQSIECKGNPELLLHKGNTLFLFQQLDKNAEIFSKIGPIDWYQLPDTITPITSGTDYLYPEHGAGYMIKNGEEREFFWVFDYDRLRPQISDVTANLTCENTTINITGNIPAMNYTTPHGTINSYPRTCQIIYLDQQWSESQWVDSIAVATVEFQNTMIVGASPVATDFTIVDSLATLFQQVGDSIHTDIYAPVALKAHPLAIVTTRPNDKSNEVERPVDPETLIRRSAPLEITFKANALNTEYYKWELYRGSELMLTRNEAQHKYTFEEPGNYRATLTMSNSNGCEYKSEDFDISVSESMLLVPNVFTPNGDGTHDEFRVVYRSLKEFHCWVFNRWGHQVYEWTDPAKGWDGTINGKPAAAGAYYYVIRALGTDADSDYISKPSYSRKLKKGELPIGVYQLSGDINLLR